MRSGPAPVPWVAIGFFLPGSFSLLTLIYALGNPDFGSNPRTWHLLNVVFLVFGTWGVRLMLLCYTCGALYIPFADSNQREL